MDARFVIYGLVDPRTGQLRYVGKSCSGMKRPKEHGYPSFLRRAHTHCSAWVKSLLAAGLAYEVEVLEVCADRAQLAEAEQHYIAYFRSIGCDLTNLTAGGEGASGKRVPADVRQKISTSNALTKARLTAEQQTALVAEYRLGKTTYDLAKSYGVERHTVARIIRRNGGAVRTKPEIRRKLPAAVEPVIIEMYERGATLTAVADRFDTYSSNIYALLKRCGVRIRSRSEALLARRRVLEAA